MAGIDKEEFYRKVEEHKVAKKFRLDELKGLTALNTYILFSDGTTEKAIDAHQTVVATALGCDPEYKVLKRDELDEYWVSTVFLHMDHNFGGLNTRPVLFETMIFKGRDMAELYCTRYNTYEEALHGHEIALRWLKELAKGKPSDLVSPNPTEREIARHFRVIK